MASASLEWPPTLSWSVKQKALLLYGSIGFFWKSFHKVPLLSLFFLSFLFLLSFFLSFFFLFFFFFSFFSFPQWRLRRARGSKPWLSWLTEKTGLVSSPFHFFFLCLWSVSLIYVLSNLFYCHFVFFSVILSFLLIMTQSHVLSFLRILKVDIKVSHQS